jgi:hypothetical protein
MLLGRSWQNSTQVASIGIVTLAIDDAGLGYLHHELIPLAEHLGETNHCRVDHSKGIQLTLYE